MAPKLQAAGARLRAGNTVRAALLASFAEEQDRLEGYGLGANSYMRKPVDFAEFVDAVRQLGLCWLLLNERPPAPNPLRLGANTNR